ncbi:MAG: ATP-binding protein [Luteolibacter sp.]
MMTVIGEGPGEADELEVARFTCGCGNIYYTYGIPVAGILIRLQRKCDACEDREREERLAGEARQAALLQERLRGERSALSQAVIPERYRMSDVTHPTFNVRLWTGLQSWQPTKDKPWLGIIGGTGMCKTRCATLLLDAAILAGTSRHPAFLTSYQLTRATQNQFSENKGEAAAAREQLASTRESDWLVLDDLGKARHTPAVAAALFAILDDRHARNAVTLWTANSTPGEFTRDMSPDIAGPICGRLLECSEVFRLR